MEGEREGGRGGGDENGKVKASGKVEGERLHPQMVRHHGHDDNPLHSNFKAGVHVHTFMYVCVYVYVYV